MDANVAKSEAWLHPHEERLTIYTGKLSSVYCKLVNPPLKYCVQVWSSNNVKDIETIEYMQEIDNGNILE